MSTAVLSPGAGYGIVLGLGLGFAGAMIVISQLQARYTKRSLTSSEEFTSASRSLNPGIIASGIVSAATWASTLLQSTTVCYVYGLSGPYWYGAGSVSQIMYFAQNAIELKRNAPGAHTFLEPIRVRWGRTAHLLFAFYGLGTNILLTGQLITGGSSTMTALTGMSVYAACVLIPFTVVVYAVVGGLLATFFSDYVHTTLIFCIILAFMFSTFASGAALGSPAKVWDLLQDAAAAYPLAGNAAGSYTTFRSTDGLVFGIIVIISGITTVCMDQTYWQRAVASKASTSVKGYLWGGMAFLPVAWAFATAAGLGLVALTAVPGSAVAHHADPSYAAAAAAAALLGKSGATALLVTLFLAVTSAASAELVAVASIVVYDLMPYVKRGASERLVLRVTHLAVVGYGIFMAVWGIALYEIGISLSWLYGLTGVMFSCGVVPVSMAIRIRAANKWGCILGSVFGFVCAVAAWLATAKGYYGSISVTATGGSYPQLAGNAAGLILSGLVCVVTSWIWPENYDFEHMRRFNFAPPDAPGGAVPAAATGEPGGGVSDGKDVDGVALASLPAVGVVADDDMPIHNVNDVDEAELAKEFKKAATYTALSFVVLCVAAPAFAAIPAVWSRAGFTTWIVIIFIYTFVAMGVVVVWPIWESRGALLSIVSGLWRDLRRGRS